MDSAITYPKARKQHKCELCRGKIPIGEKYERQAVFDGTAWTAKAHIACVNLASKMKMFEDGDGIGSDDFIEAVTEKWIEITEHSGGRNNTPPFGEVLERIKLELLP